MLAGASTPDRQIWRRQRTMLPTTARGESRRTRPVLPSPPRRPRRTARPPSTPGRANLRRRLAQAPFYGDQRVKLELAGRLSRLLFIVMRIFLIAVCCALQLCAAEDPKEMVRRALSAYQHDDAAERQYT